VKIELGGGVALEEDYETQAWLARQLASNALSGVVFRLLRKKEFRRDVETYAIMKRLVARYVADHWAEIVEVPPNAWDYTALLNRMGLVVARQFLAEVQ